MANNYLLEYEPSRDDLRHLREWLESKPHIIQDYENSFLAAFVRGCKGNLQKSKSELENFNRIGLQYPKLFGNLDPQYSILQEHLQVTRIFPLPKRLEDGTIILVAVLDPDFKDAPYKFHSLEMFRYLLQWLYIFLWEDDYGPGKGIAILDQKNLTLTHFRDLTPIALMHLLKVLQTALPVRPQAIHLLNLSPIMTTFFNFLKKIIPKKFSSKIYFHSSMETLYEKIPKDLLPKEYGGCQESVMTLHHQWKNKVESYREKLLQENLKMRRLDHLRPKEFEPSKDDLRKLREWLMKMPHLPQDYDDRFLTAFIRGCKGSLQKTKLVLENFNSLGMKYPELFGNLDPLSPILQEHLNSTRIFPLPHKSQDGSTILMGTFRPDYEERPYEVHTVEFYRYWLQTLYIQIWENEFEAGKYIVLWDLRHSSLTHVRDLTPVVIKQLLEVLKTSVPVRLQAIHCLYVPPFLEWLVNFAKSIAKQKLASRIFVHSSLETCYKQVPKELFPKEYGGSQDSINALHERWKKKAESYRNNLINEEIKMRGLDHIRPKEEDVDEMSGTFRMLNVD